jgi:hypothetical protein
MSNSIKIFVSTGNDAAPQVLRAVASPTIAVDACRSVIAQQLGDETADKLFGIRVPTERGFKRSAMERGMISGLRSGEGFATMAGGITVAAAADMDTAIDAIADVERLATIGRDILTY